MLDLCASDLYDKTVLVSMHSERLAGGIKATYAEGLVTLIEVLPPNILSIALA